MRASVVNDSSDDAPVAVVTSFTESTTSHSGLPLASSTKNVDSDDNDDENDDDAADVKEINKKEDKENRGQKVSETMKKSDNDNDHEKSDKNATSSKEDDEDDSHGDITSDSHRSTVSTFVHSLLSVAGRTGGIGQQVRVVAERQNMSASTTVEALAKVEERGSFKTFFFGTDYKSIDAIRNELATTTTVIDELKTLASKMSTSTEKETILKQVDVLEEEHSKLMNYVEEKENAFSLFGWFTKRFLK